MRYHRLKLHTLMEATFARFRDLPRESVESVGTRVLSHLRRQPEWHSAKVYDCPQETALTWKWPAIASLAAVVVIAVALPGRLSPTSAAVFETGSGSRTVQYGELVHSGTIDGGTLRLKDGSSVELRRESELFLEPTKNRIHVRLR